MSSEPFIGKDNGSSVHLLEHDLRAEGFAVAAWQLEDAIKDRLVDLYPSDLNARRLHFDAAGADIEFRRALGLLVLLSIFETPSWCRTDENFFNYMPANERCQIEGAETVLLSDLPYIPPGWGVLLEVVLVLVFARKMLLDRKLQTWYFKPLGVEYFNMHVIHFGLAMAVMELMDCACFMAFRPRYRVAFIARTGFLCILPQVRSLFTCIGAVIYEFFSIAYILAIVIVFFGWVAVTIFGDIEGQVDNLPALGKVNKGLDTFPGTVYSMFVAGSTDDFVQVFIAPYTKYRHSGLLWLLFLAIVQVLLLNLVLDTLVGAYSKHSEDTEEESIKDKTAGIVKAFETLTEVTKEGDKLSKASFLEFIHEFSSSPYMRTIPPATAEIVFQAVDEDCSGYVEVNEFFSICAVVEYNFWTTTIDSPVKDEFPWLWEKLASLRAYVETDHETEHSQLDSFMNYVLLTNLLLVVAETVLELESLGESFILGYLELIFSFVYVIEVGLVLSVKSWGYYWSARTNQFDFIVTWLLLGSSILDEVAASSAGNNVKRYMNILRLLRLLRVIKQLKNLKTVTFMVETISCLVAASKDIFSLLGIVIFFFATLSVQLWGGLLYKGAPGLEESEYAEKNFYVFNFNDFLMAFGSWVVSLLCNYVQCFPDAIWRCTTGYMRGTWWVFFLFYIVGVTIIFQLVKAFTIEVFLELNKERKHKHNEDDFQVLDEIKKEFKANNLALHYRMEGDTSLHRKMLKEFKELEREKLEEEEESHDRGHEHSEHTGSPHDEEETEHSEHSGSPHGEEQRDRGHEHSEHSGSPHGNGHAAGDHH